MLQIPKVLRIVFPAKLTRRLLSKAALLCGDFQCNASFSRCACQTSMLQIPKVLRIVFPAKLTRRFLSKAALLCGDFQCNAIFFTLCVSNFHASNPKSFAHSISCQVNPKIFEQNCTFVW